MKKNKILIASIIAVIASILITYAFFQELTREHVNTLLISFFGIFIILLIPTKSKS